MSKTKSHKDLGPNSYVCRNYREKIDRGEFVKAMKINIILA